MGRQIQDQFTGLTISRQLKYQRRKRAQNRCVECGEPSGDKARCPPHLKRARERYAPKGK